MFTPAYKRYALAALTAVYMLNLVDRGLMILLLQPIKEDLHLSDTQLGLLTGIAFGLFYATLGVPIARWADRSNRVTITALAIGLWGVTVMASLFVTNYLQMLVARIAAAIGESGCKPPTYSLIGDYFPQPAERARAMGVYLTGNGLATLLSFILGGWLNELYGWRLTFVIMGIPGLILAVIIKLTIVEPRTLAGAARVPQHQPPLAEVMRILWRQRSLRHLTLALILLYTLGQGLSPWYAAFMIRSHGMGTGELGLWLGLMVSLAGIAGALLGSFVAARWFPGNERGQMRMSAVAVASIVPWFVAFLTLPRKNQALAALLPLFIAFGFFLGPTYALMQRLVADEMRATMMAMVMLLANLIGMGLGPLLVGVLSDWMMPSLGTESLRYAMLIISFVALWAGCHFWLVGRSVKADLGRMRREPALPGDADLLALTTASQTPSK